MKKVLSLLFVTTFFCNAIFSQSDYSIYSILEVFEPFLKKESQPTTDDCISCRIEYYDKNYNSKSKSVRFSNDASGEFTDYYPNGGIKAKGKCVENTDEHWNPNGESTSHLPNGTWTFYKKDGSVDYQEFWENGKFLRQEPIQDKAEIWDVALMLGDVRIDTASRNVKIRMEDLNKLSIVPLFKNDKENVSISLGLYANIKDLEHSSVSMYNSYVQKKIKGNTLKKQDTRLENYLERLGYIPSDLEVQLVVKADKYTIDYFKLEFVE